MKDNKIYCFIITFLFFATLWAGMIMVWQIHTTSNAGNRYQIVNSDNLVILLDKRTGLTWRNTWNNNKDKIPSDWELMNQYGEYTNVPYGEQVRRDNMVKSRQTAAAEPENNTNGFDLEKYYNDKYGSKAKQSRH